MSGHRFIFGARGGAAALPLQIRWEYDSVNDIYYQGYGKVTDTDSDTIDIKRVTIDPVTGTVTEEWATGPWDDRTTLIYS